ncbi:MAG: hypothetical protein AAFX85_09190, partial [Pseudomonadota bacterium]
TLTVGDTPPQGVASVKGSRGWRSSRGRRQANSNLLMRGTVETLLSRTPAERLVGPRETRLGGPLPWSFTYGVRPKRQSLLVVALSVIGLLIGAAVAVSFALEGGWNASRLMALSLVAYLVLTMAIPKLLGSKRGSKGWERQVMIDAQQVRVIDRYGDQSLQWRQALTRYRDIRHRVVEIEQRQGEGETLDVVELRHAEPGRSIYLQGRRREHGAQEGADVEALLAEVSETLALPLTREPR